MPYAVGQIGNPRHRGRQIELTPIVRPGRGRHREREIAEALVAAVAVPHLPERRRDFFRRHPLPLVDLLLYLGDRTRSWRPPVPEVVALRPRPARPQRLLVELDRFRLDPT